MIIISIIDLMIVDIVNEIYMYEFDSKFETTSNWIGLTCLLTYVYGTSAAEAEDQQVKDEARLQVVHGSVDGTRARGHRTLITAPAKIEFQKKVTHTYKRGS